MSVSQYFVGHYVSNIKRIAVNYVVRPLRRAARRSGQDFGKPNPGPGGSHHAGIHLGQGDVIELRTPSRRWPLVNPLEQTVPGPATATAN